MFPDAGKRDRLVTIQQRPSADAVDESHVPVDGPWTTLYSGYFERMEMSGRERFTANQLSAPYDTRWRGNYRVDMDRDLVDVPKLRRLVFKTRVYDIVDAQTIGRNEGVDLLTLSGGTVS